LVSIADADDIIGHYAKLFVIEHHFGDDDMGRFLFHFYYGTKQILATLTSYL
jgi:hypothetical protein